VHHHLSTVWSENSGSVVTTPPHQSMAWNESGGQNWNFTGLGHFPHNNFLLMRLQINLAMQEVTLIVEDSIIANGSHCRLSGEKVTWRQWREKKIENETELLPRSCLFISQTACLNPHCRVTQRGESYQQTLCQAWHKSNSVNGARYIIQRSLKTKLWSKPPACPLEISVFCKS